MDSAVEKPTPRSIMEPSPEGFLKVKTSKLTKKKNGAALDEELIPSPSPPSPSSEVSNMRPSFTGLPPFPEMRKARVYDGSKGDGVEFIEVNDSAVQRTTVSEEFVEQYVVNDFRKTFDRSHIVYGQSTKLL